jgi:hypothetical protein
VFSSQVHRGSLVDNTLHCLIGASFAGARAVSFTFLPESSTTLPCPYFEAALLLIMSQLNSGGADYRTEDDGHPNHGSEDEDNGLDLAGAPAEAGSSSASAAARPGAGAGAAAPLGAVERQTEGVLQDRNIGSGDSTGNPLAPGVPTAGADPLQPARAGLASDASDGASHTDSSPGAALSGLNACSFAERVRMALLHHAFNAPYYRRRLQLTDRTDNPRCASPSCGERSFKHHPGCDFASDPCCELCCHCWVTREDVGDYQQAVARRDWLRIAELERLMVQKALSAPPEAVEAGNSDELRSSEVTYGQYSGSSNSFSEPSNEGYNNYTAYAHYANMLRVTFNGHPFHQVVDMGAGLFSMPDVKTLKNGNVVLDIHKPRFVIVREVKLLKHPRVVKICICDCQGPMARDFALSCIVEEGMPYDSVREVLQELQQARKELSQSGDSGKSSCCATACGHAKALAFALTRDDGGRVQPRAAVFVATSPSYFMGTLGFPTQTIRVYPHTDNGIDGAVVQQSSTGIVRCYRRDCHHNQLRCHHVHGPACLTTGVLPAATDDSDSEDDRASEGDRESVESKEADAADGKTSRLPLHKKDAPPIFREDVFGPPAYQFIDPYPYVSALFLNAREISCPFHSFNSFSTPCHFCFCCSQAREGDCDVPTRSSAS